MIVAVDGPAGSGKGTVTKLVGDELGLINIDTGTTYRCVALETLNKDAVVYDVIYNPKKTVLIKAAEKLNLRTITGLDMLVYQAVAAQEIWFGHTPDWKDMKIAALEAL